MNISVAVRPSMLMFGKGFMHGIKPSGAVFPVNISNGMPIVRVRRPVIDMIRRKPSRKLVLGQK